MAVKDTINAPVAQEANRWKLPAVTLTIGVLWVLAWGQLQNLAAESSSAGLTRNSMSKSLCGKSKWASGTVPSNVPV